MPRGKPNKGYTPEFKTRVVEMMKTEQLSSRETDRRFELPSMRAAALNQKWVTDVTEFSLFGEKMYLSPIPDLHSSDLVSYVISDRPVLSMVMNMISNAACRLSRGAAPILHADKGRQ